MFKRIVFCIVIIGFSLLAAGVFGGLASQSFYKYKGVATLPVNEYNALVDESRDYDTFTIESTTENSVTFYYEFRDAKANIHGLAGVRDNHWYWETLITQIVTLCIGIAFCIVFLIGNYPLTTRTKVE